MRQTAKNNKERIIRDTADFIQEHFGRHPLKSILLYLEFQQAALERIKKNEYFLN